MATPGRAADLGGSCQRKELVATSVPRSVGRPPVHVSIAILRTPTLMPANYGLKIRKVFAESDTIYVKPRLDSVSTESIILPEDIISTLTKADP
jgi:hypothetical protein